MSSRFIKSAEAFGIAEEEILFFNSNNANLINYLSLTENCGERTSLLTGVIEASGQPLVYLSDSECLAQAPRKRNEEIHQLIKILSCRGEKAYLAVISSGTLEIHPIRASETLSNSVKINRDDSGHKGFVRDLIEGSLSKDNHKILHKNNSDNQTIESILFELLMSVSKELNKTKQLRGKHSTILSLCGRALLARFLIDRGIMTSKTFKSILKFGNPANCFSTPEYAALTNVWLDDTFNGDLLKLPVSKNEYASWFSSIDDKAFKKLSFILGHTNAGGQYSLPGFINFAHVPVGLLSEVYEKYAHESLDDDVRSSARAESIHYTPRRLAGYMLSEAFDGLTTCQPHQSKILDPSCGAGVFVVLAFRRLIAEHWRANNIRPDTQKIREILYTQITGFDINESALTLAALGLYLSALELDPEPLPTTKLKFSKNLIGTVLFPVREKGKSLHSVAMGSLGPAVCNSHCGKYDMVIGNPPWSSFPRSFSKSLSDCVREVAKNRDPILLSDVVDSHQNPDQVPDLPFVWKSMEWAKSGGIISFALHARLLFKNSEKGILARNHLFKALNITGIINGSALRNSRVWPHVTAQFCLLFARNEIPSARNYFNYINPKYERSLNEDQGRMRIDFQSRDPVQARALESKPYLLNVLFKGTSLDVGVIEIIQNLIKSNNALPLEKYWESSVGKDKSGVGFQTSSEEQDASHLIKMGARMLSKNSDTGYVLHARGLPEFKFKRLHRVRKLSIYETPLVLINKAIGANKTTVSARVALEKAPIAYNESFYGYSAKGHPDAKALAKYLFFILNSDLFLYYTLMTSSQYGVEREVIHKADVDGFPVIPYEKLDKKLKNKIEVLFNDFEKSLDIVPISKFIYSIYGIDKYSESVIKDTLKISSPISSSKSKAASKVTANEMAIFCNELEIAIYPKKVDVNFIDGPLESWRFIVIRMEGAPIVQLKNERVISEIADNSGCSMIKINSQNSLIIGILNQYRYWTVSRARLLAIQILKERSLENFKE